MSKPFKMYRIICTLTDKALVSGSDWPTRSQSWPPHDRLLPWHNRGQWSASGGAFWKTERPVRQHLQNLCHDWVTRFAPHRYPSYPNQQTWWHEAKPGPADWSRLQYLRVEQIYITNHSTTILPASDFMGIVTPAEASS